LGKSLNLGVKHPVSFPAVETLDEEGQTRGIGGKHREERVGRRDEEGVVSKLRGGG